jgi:hypothetical protein
MAFLSFIDRIIIPAVMVILIIGGISGTLLGCALVFRSAAALRFIGRMNSWVSTRQVLMPLDAQHNVDPAPGPGGRRPRLGAFLLIGGVLAVYFLIVRLDFARGPYIPGVDFARWFLSGLALESTKWILVAGSGFAALIGLLMLIAPGRLAVFETRVNEWHSSRRLLAADEKMHLPLEPHVEAHPGAAGWTIAVASLLVTLTMAGMFIARLH